MGAAEGVPFYVIDEVEDSDAVGVPGWFGFLGQRFVSYLSWGLAPFLILLYLGKITMERLHYTATKTPALVHVTSIENIYDDITVPLESDVKVKPRALRGALALAHPQRALPLQDSHNGVEGCVRKRHGRRRPLEALSNITPLAIQDKSDIAIIGEDSGEWWHEALVTRPDKRDRAPRPRSGDSASSDVEEGNLAQEWIDDTVGDLNELVARRRRQKEE